MSHKLRTRYPIIFHVFDKYWPKLFYCHIRQTLGNLQWSDPWTSNNSSPDYFVKYFLYAVTLFAEIWSGQRPEILCQTAIVITESSHSNRFHRPWLPNLHTKPRNSAIISTRCCRDCLNVVNVRRKCFAFFPIIFILCRSRYAQSTTP